jgi:ArsR family transcriptional regulator
MAARKKKKKKKASKATTTKRPRVKARRRPAGSKGPTDAPREISVFDPDSVEAVLDVMPDEETLQMAADRLQGLAHPSRLKALIALSVAELCVGDVAALVGLSLSATSTMLKQLRALGYLSTRGVGKQTYYRISSEAPSRVMEVVFAPEGEE